MTVKAKPDVPRWRRGKLPPGHVTAVLVPPQPAEDVQRAAFRFRYHLVPFGWGVWMLGAGFVLNAAHAVPVAAMAGIGSAALAVLLTRHLGRYARGGIQVMAALTALWVPVLAAVTRAPVPALAVASWAAVTAFWVQHYRWRPQEIPPPAAPTDAETFAALAAKRKWSGHLGTVTELPGGGKQYPIILNGAESNIGEVLAHPRPIAAAWNKPMTEAFAEADPTGIESRGLLTILRGDTLARLREWDGRGVDPQTGIAVPGRFADGKDARIRFWVPRNGAKHGLLAGTTGSGKTYTLDLIVRIAVECGLIVPVVLDPQEGQSLPQWRGHVRYASGIDECMKMLRGIKAGMFGRSRDLAGRAWVDEDGHPMQGMDFYDPHLTGLPLVLAIGDELPLLFGGTSRADAKRAEEAVSIAEDIAKLGRKTGVSLWPAAQVPSLGEMASRVLRSMLVGGNVVCLRTGEGADAGMIRLGPDPSTLPLYFPDGSATAGLGYVVGPDQRQAPARMDMVPRQVRRVIPEVPKLDPAFAWALDDAMGG